MAERHPGRHGVIGVGKLNRDGATYAARMSFVTGVWTLRASRLRLGNRRGFPRDKLHIWTALRPDGGEEQVWAAVFPILRHFVVASTGDDCEATKDADFQIARLHRAIMQAGPLAIDVTRLAVDDGRRVNINEIVAVQAPESIEIALRLRCVSRILGLQSLIGTDRAIAIRGLRPGGGGAEDQAGKERTF